MRSGFILTRQSKDLGFSSLIELWVSTDLGPTLIQIPDQKSVYFINNSDEAQVQQLAKQLNIPCETKPLPLKTFQLEATTACYFPTRKHASDFETVLTNHSIPIYESDIRLVDRYLMERFIQGQIEFDGVEQQENGYLKIANAQCRAAKEYSPNLSVVSLDIECSAKGVLYSVGLDSKLDSRVIMIGEAQPEQGTPIQWVENERALLLALIDWFTQFDPDIIVGWNVIGFDMRLLVQRAEKNKLRATLGRGKQTCFYRQSNQSQQGFITIPGRVVVDGIDGLKSATYSFDSWSLESVSQELLHEGKAIHNVQDRMEEINHMFHHDKPALAKYNLQDCVLVNKIFEKTHLLDYLIQRSKLTGLALDRIGGSVAAFSNLYLPRLHRGGYVAPNLMPNDWIASPGGFVMDSRPGLYDSVLVLDFKSLYPAIIRSFLIDPMGLIEGLQLEIGNEPDQAVPGFRKAQFHREKHFLPNLIEELWQARDQAKKDKEVAFSQAIKIIMNSFYGVLGSSGCRFFDTRLASSITLRGHEIMKTTRKLIEEQGYEVIYGDTDSTFVSLKDECTQEQADDIGNALTKHINSWWTQHLTEEYNLTSLLELEYETHFSRFFMPTIRGSETGSKKRYAGLITQESGSRIVFKGLESARSDWTELARDFQAHLYELIFAGSDPTQFILDTVEQVESGEMDNKLVYRKRLRRRLHEYQKNIPPQVRAARLADEINQQLGRPLQYQNRGRIAYMMTTIGPEPLEYVKNPIDYEHYIDKQIKPIADAILPFVGLKFDDINAPQLGLF
ncbi:DNA polymerase II [Vibrio breoganii]|uniref:DNA polymerase II n=1 Tax=Vibrio breoganii TaxID=553239 RepID=UPI000C861FC0|nr:DNA polymerase II [Vibrio breoganii]PML35780.1 DNA polymerase II [Vibrio breoganii]PML61576.1 DNA polymerase II [Vibrio breoganii]PMO73446.1 DNA polymerase II [Vibrio breoganii]PMO78630.1 DNA polymerase II [Vibrio breoganii]PMO84695.1 DNA polymerase II [Vibrio breoganii]